MFAVNGILFNHESERRGENFVTRKITLAAARIKQGFQDKLYLGNLDAKRDWGYAKDYVECMWLILQNDKPEDFVIATGEMHTVREFCTLAFHYLNIELEWQGSGVDEKGIDKATGRVLVEVDPKYFRPCEVEQLLGDPTKAKETLGWNPTKTPFPELVRIMVEHDMRFVKKLHLKAEMDKTRAPYAFRLLLSQNLQAQSTHENGYIKPRKTFWRNSKQLLKLTDVSPQSTRGTRRLLNNSSVILCVLCGEFFIQANY